MGAEDRETVEVDIAMGQAHKEKVEVDIGAEGSPYCIKSLV